MRMGGIEVDIKEQTEQVKHELISFLEKFQEYEEALELQKEPEPINRLRIELQLVAPKITNYLVAIMGDIPTPRQTWIPALSVSTLLFRALLETHDQMYASFAEYIEVVTSVLRKAIGTIEAGLWPRQEVSPVLVLSDGELKDRCSDLLAAPKNYDRVIREATVILENRIRSCCPHDLLSHLIPNSADQQGENLVNKLFSPRHPILSISSDQLKRVAFHKILLGVFAYFRNPFHHSIDPETEWSWAWSTVGLIDILLTEIKNCVVVENRQQ